MDLLADRKAEDSPIFKAHMERTLKEHARKMNTEQMRGYSAFKDPSFTGRSYTTDGDSLTYTQAALYRFVDMKKLRYPGSNTQYKRKKVYDFHNRIIMGHYNGIMKELIYGASEEVIADLKKNFPDEVK